MSLVVIESPYASATVQGRKDNITYLRRCLRDSLMRGEAPFASHAIYTQYGVLDDTLPEERAQGIAAGIAWGAKANLVAIYVDLGISSGMVQGVVAAVRRGIHVEVRALDRLVDHHDHKAIAVLKWETLKQEQRSVPAARHDPPTQLWFHFHPAPHMVMPDGSERPALNGDLWHDPFESQDEAQAELADNAAEGWIVVGPYTRERDT